MAKPLYAGAIVVLTTGIAFTINLVTSGLEAWAEDWQWWSLATGVLVLVAVVLTWLNERRKTDEGVAEPVSRTVNLSNSPVIGLNKGSVNITYGLADRVEDSRRSVVLKLPPRNPDFCGREDILHEVDQLLRAADSAAVAIYGLGGVGKSQVAAELAHRVRSRFEIVWWLDAADVPSIRLSFSRLAGALELGVAATDEALIEMVKSEMIRRGRTLLIFDNVADPSDISPFVPAQGQVLITSRRPDWGGIARGVELQEMSLDDSVALLASHRVNGDVSEIGALAALLGRLPLALAQAEAYVRTRNISVREYISLYHTHAERLVASGPKLPNGYPDTVATTWAIHYEFLQESHPQALDLLFLCAFLDPDAIDIRVLVHESPPDGLPASLDAIRNVRVQFDEVVAVVRGTSLLTDAGEGLFRIHRLVQDVTRWRLSKREKTLWLGRVTVMLHAIMPQDGDQPENWPRAEVCVAHAINLLRFVRELPQGKWIQAVRLMNKVAHFVGSKGDMKSAAEILRVALEITNRKELKRVAELVVQAQTASNLGTVLYELRDFDGALKLTRKAWRIQDELMRRGRVGELGALLDRMGNIYEIRGELAMAVQSFRDAIAFDEERFGPMFRDLVPTLVNLGRVLVRSGRTIEAVRELARAREIVETEYGADHSMMAQVLFEMARLAGAVGAAERERTLLEEALQLEQVGYGEDHVEVAGTLYRLGEWYEAHGSRQQAAQHFARASAIFTEAYGEHDDRAVRAVQRAARNGRWWRRVTSR